MDIKNPEVAVFNRNLIGDPSINDLPTLEDVDERKLSAMDQLFKKMMEFKSELNSVHLTLKTDRNDQSPRLNLYELVDIGYAGCVKILIKSNWLDIEWISPDNKFNFELYVVQKGKYGIADWIDIRICYLNTFPIALASLYECVKTLGFLLDPKDYFFHDLPMNCTDKIIDGRLNFSTITFKEAVKDACEIMQKIISRKEYLRIYKRKP